MSEVSEYQDDPTYGRDDFGSYCLNCDAFISEDCVDFCGPDCRLEYQERDDVEDENGR